MMIDTKKQLTIWEELSGDVSDGPRLVRRVASSPIGMWFGESRPNRLKELGIEITKDIEEKLIISSLPKMRGLQYSFENDFSKETNALWLRAADASFNDQFPVLADDLLRVVVDHGKNNPVEVVSSRLLYWQKFFSKGIRKLSRESQIGLFGELCVLKQFLNFVPKDIALESWRGPLGSSKDFVFPKMCFEVKSSTSNQPKSIKISSEFQLLLENEKLFILEIRLEENMAFQGKNLPALIDELRSIFVNTPEHLGIFEELLIEAGYFELFRDEYSAMFTLIEVNSFAVTETFPKITPELLDHGIENVSYEISMNQMIPFRCETKSLYSQLAESLSL